MSSVGVARRRRHGAIQQALHWRFFFYYRPIGMEPLAWRQTYIQFLQHNHTDSFSLWKFRPVSDISASWTNTADSENVTALFASCDLRFCVRRTRSSTVDRVQSVEVSTVRNERQPLDPADNHRSCSVNTSPALIYMLQQFVTILAHLTKSQHQISALLKCQINGLCRSCFNKIHSKVS